MLAVGEEARTRRVREALGTQRPGAYRVVAAVSIGEATRCLHEQEFDVVVLVAPVRGATLEHALSGLRTGESAGSGPIAAGPIEVALVPDEFPEARARALYARGACAVFAWPEDLTVLASLLERAQRRDRDPEHCEAKVVRSDALERTVRDRLGVRFRRPSRDVSVDTHGGIARLSGRVLSLWAKLALKRRTSESPGVEGVQTAGLRVDDSGRSDAAIGRDIRALLDGTATIDATTIAVSVHGARVVLSGVLLEGEREYVVDLVSMVPGVRSVTDRSRSSRAHKQRAGELASRLQAEIRDTGRGTGKVNGDARAGKACGRDLRVAVVGATAVLRGVGTPVEIRTAKRRLGRWIRRSGAIRKVVQRAGPRLREA